jgi:hypothetical protein
MNRAFVLVGLFFVAVCPTFLMAQHSPTYTTYSDLDAVKIDYTVQLCGEEPNTITEFNMLRLTNKTDHAITVSFKIEYYYNGICTTCNTNEYQVSFNLPANGTLSPDCTSLSGPAGHLALIKKYINRNFGQPLDRFELTNILVQ